MSRGNRQWAAVLAAAGLLLGAAVSADRAPKTEVSDRDRQGFIPPVFEKVMQACTAKIDAAETLQFEVRITVRPSGPTATGPRTRRYRVSMAYPDRFAVVPLAPGEGRIGIVCNGEKTLYYIPSRRQYYLVPGPGLDTGLVRASYWYDSVLHAALAPLMRTEKTLERAPRNLAGSDRIVPMGEVEFGGVQCEAFLNWSVPELHYFEKGGTGLYRGFQGKREDGWAGPVGSRAGDDWYAGEAITVLAIEKLVVDGDVPASAFDMTPPAGYEQVQDLQPMLNGEEGKNAAGVAAPPLAGDLSAQASPADVRHRAESLCEAGYNRSPAVGQLFQRAADGGDALAQMWVARAYARGFFSVPVDHRRAVELGRTAIAEVKRLAEGGDAAAQFLLAGAYMDGLGVAASPQEAFRWTQTAAQHGHPIAAYNTGILLRGGKGVPQNLLESVRWLEQAAAKGYPQALIGLGEAYQWGAGVAPDRQKAIVCMARGWAAMGDGLSGLRQLAPGLVPHGFTRADLEKTPGVDLLGATVDELQPALARAGVVPADAVAVLEDVQVGTRCHAYRRQGVRFGSHFDRISEVYFLADGVNGFSGYKGALPLGLKWTDTIESVRQRIRDPDYDGDVDGRNEHVLCAKVDDLELGVRFSHDEPKRMRSVNVYLRWVSPPKGAAAP